MAKTQTALAPAPSPARPSSVLLDPETGAPYTSRRGRPWGSIDLVDGDMRAHIHAAYLHAGGPAYLHAMAVSDTPSDRTAYMGLLGKLVPTEIKGSLNGNFTVELVNYAQQKPVIEMVSRVLESALLE